MGVVVGKGATVGVCVTVGVGVAVGRGVGVAVGWGVDVGAVDEADGLGELVAGALEGVGALVDVVVAGSVEPPPPPPHPASVRETSTRADPNPRKRMKVTLRSTLLSPTWASMQESVHYRSQPGIPVTKGLTGKNRAIRKN